MLHEWLPNARILIVDDEPANVELLERLLAHAGYSNILSTTDSRTVMTLVEAFEPDIILLDWLMPHLGGREVLRELRSLLSERHFVPVLVLTADITRETRQSALSGGAKDFLTKPLDAVEMELRIRNLLETRYLNLELLGQNESLAREVAERRRAEAELRRSEERFRAIFVSSPDLVLLVSEQGAILDASPVVEQMLGYRAEALRGQPVASLMAATGQARAVHSGGDTAGVRWLAQTLAHGRCEETEELLRADRTRCPADLAATTLSLGEQRMVLAVMRDATMRLRAESEIRNALAREQELGQLKSSFISMTSHEFRTPLSTILSSAELLEHYGFRWSEEKRGEHIRRIQQSVRHMTRLLDDVLFIGRSDAGRMSASATPIEVYGFVEGVIDDLEFALKAPGRMRLSAQQQPIEANLDPNLLRQILINLLTNAVKYSPDGSPVSIELAQREGAVHLQVADRGIGIPPESLEHLYEAFHRASNVDTIAGTGLGLAIVKRSVDAMGGTVACESTVGSGTTFRITLPLRPGGALDGQNPDH